MAAPRLHFVYFARLLCVCAITGLWPRFACARVLHNDHKPAARALKAESDPPAFRANLVPWSSIAPPDFPKAAGDVPVSAGVDIFLKVVEIMVKVSNIANGQDRAGFTQGVRDQAYYSLPDGRCYNIMVCKDDFADDQGLVNVNTFAQLQFEDQTFNLYIFESGTFVNTGDGGYINWAYRGTFNNVDDKTINFTPC